MLCALGRREAVIHSPSSNHRMRGGNYEESSKRRSSWPRHSRSMLQCRSVRLALAAASLTNVVVSSPSTGGGYPVPAGATPADARDVRAELAQLQPLRVVARRQAGHRDARRLVEVLRREVLDVLQLLPRRLHDAERHAGRQRTRSRATTASRPGTQAMPPSWTNNTDPNVDFDTQGRVYQTTLPFNAYWAGGMHPNGAIDVSYSRRPRPALGQGQRRRRTSTSPNRLASRSATSRTSSGSPSTHVAATCTRTTSTRCGRLQRRNGNGKIMRRRLA